jgi:hypothetical protein
MNLRKQKVYVPVSTDSPSLLVVPYQGGDSVEDIVEQREGYFLTEEELNEYVEALSQGVLKVAREQVSRAIDDFAQFQENIVDNSESDQWPKILLIYNEKGGLVWQVYHVHRPLEALRLAKNARKNGFNHITLEDYMDDMEETWPDWRQTDGGKKICE